MTQTTSRRLPLWLQGVSSLREHVDMSMIHKCVIIDDSSDQKDLVNMRLAWSSYFPAIPMSILSNDCEGQFRHHHSMELWRGIIHDQEFVLHVEDDCIFDPGSKDCLTWAKTVLIQNDWLGQAMLGIRARKFPLQAVPLWIMTMENSTEYAPSRFSLQPSVIRVDSILKTGGFRYVEGFEVEFGYRWAGRGYLTAYHPHGFCRHIGWESAYDANKSLR